MKRLTLNRKILDRYSVEREICEIARHASLTIFLLVRMNNLNRDELFIKRCEASINDLTGIPNLVKKLKGIKGKQGKKRRKKDESL